MPRIVIRIPYRAPSAAASASANGGGNPSSSSSQPKPQVLAKENSPPQKRQEPLKMPQKEKEKETTCCLNTHVTLGSTDTEASSDSTSSSGVGAGDCGLIQWVRRKSRPRSKLGKKTPTGHAPSPSKMGPASTTRNMDDTNMGGSSGSPTPENDNPVNRPVLRSTIRKRSHSAAQETDTKKLSSSPSIVGAAAIAEAENKRKEGVEWPKIQIELSKKEKEDDFFCMKGTKLPLRPTKKRPRAADKAIQNCLPGMSLLDLTRGRYDVRERKNARRQKRSGLKGMMDSDTD